MKLSKKLITSTILFTSTFSFANKDMQNETEKLNETKNLSKLELRDFQSYNRVKFFCFNGYSFLISHNGGFIQIMNNHQAVKCEYVKSEGFFIEENK